MLSVDRTRLANDFLECFCANNAESMLSVGCTNAISAPHQEPTPTPSFSPMAHTYTRPFFLPMGLLANDCNRHYSEKHFSRANLYQLFATHRYFGLSSMPIAVRHRATYRALFSLFDRSGTSFRAKEHRLCYLDSRYLSAPSFYSRAWLLYSMAEYYQFYRNLETRKV